MSRSPSLGAIANVKNPQRKQRRSFNQISAKLAPYGFLTPFIVLFFVFSVFGFVFSLYLSFHQWNPVAGMASMRFVGFENYTFSLGEPDFYKSLYNTIWLGLASGLSQHLVAIPMAYLLVSLGSKFRHFMTSAFFLPFITSTVAVSLIFVNMYSANVGIINKAIVALVNLPVINWFMDWVNAFMPLRWLEDRTLIKPAIAILQFWKFVGFHLVIYISGILTLSKEVEEAAILDGANWRQRFWHVALPHLRPFIFFGVTLTIIGSLQMFEEPFIITNGTGGIGNSGLTISMFLYKVAWEWLDMGWASAMSWLLFLIIAAVTAVQFFVFGKKGLGEH
ncbi:carbohydrate ABC transporter permease [Aliagarivorans taiwanensis]|uniref:carbohydrate ABC transporter permease n=1 Tax=Aliagarivorans taiwanensis TaxID=561966 RepID=UPI00040C009C|nr:sugar ABC transporter permease [Aliagarivorans taiwanensis]